MNETDLSPKEIRLLLFKEDVTQADIARKLGVNKSTVKRVVDGKIVSHRIREAIAEAVGLHVARIWPSIYINGGPRRPGRPRRET